MPANVNGAIKTKLEAVTQLTSVTQKRIYPGKVLPEKVDYPAVNFFRVAGGSQQSHSGLSGLGQGLYQFSCWSHNLKEADSVRETIKLALCNFIGTVGSIDFKAFKCDGDDFDLYEEGTQLWHCVLQLRIWYAEAKALA